MVQCTIDRNGGAGVVLSGESHGELIRCHFGNNGGVLEKGSGCICSPCNGNTCIGSTNGKKKPMPGFRYVDNVIMSKDNQTGNNEEARIKILPGLVQSTG